MQRGQLPRLLRSVHWPVSARRSKHAVRRERHRVQGLQHRRRPDLYQQGVHRRTVRCDQLRRLLCEHHHLHYPADFQPVRAQWRQLRVLPGHRSVPGRRRGLRRRLGRRRGRIRRFRWSGGRRVDAALFSRVRHRKMLRLRSQLRQLWSLVPLHQLVAGHEPEVRRGFFHLPVERSNRG